MKAVRIHGYREAPKLEEAPMPEVAADAVLIRVEAAALNPLDYKLQAGGMERFFPLVFPYTVGTDLAGTVEKVGSSVDAWRPGDKVIARLAPTAGGALADYAAVPAASCVAPPSSMPMTEAAGIPTAAGTASQSLFEIAGLKAGQTVLIHAGAGGVGSFAVQFAHAAGARVFATASGEGLKIVRDLGADRVIDYKSEDFTKAAPEVDVVFDTIGGDTQTRSFDILRPGGCLVSPAMPPDQALATARGVSASMVLVRLDEGRYAALVHTIDRQSIRVLIDRVVPMTQFAEALERQRSGRARGKIILTGL